MNYHNAAHIYAQVSRWAFPALIIIVCLSVITCSGERDKRQGYEARISTNEERTQQYENKLGQMIAMNEALVTGRSQDLKTFTDTLFNLKTEREKLIASVNSYTKLVQSIAFRDKEAKFIDRVINGRDTVIIQQPEDPNLIRVPRPFAYNDSSISLAGIVQKDAVKIDSIAIPNTVHIRTVEERTGFLKLGRRDVVQVLNTNPAFKNQVSTITLKPRANLWNRILKPALMLGAGIYIGSKTAK